MKLIDKTDNEEELFHLISESGTTFYVIQGDAVEIVYDSGRKFIWFKGRLSKEKFAQLLAIGYRKNKITIDEKEDELVVE